MHFLLPLLTLTLTLLLHSSSSSSNQTHHTSSHSDATALLAFKLKADTHSTLKYSLNSTTHFCKWHGVQCLNNRVIRFILIDLPLHGIFPSHTLTNLDQLRVLTLQNTSLIGSIPDLSSLTNLKTLFLDHNHFTGSFPVSLASLHRIRTIDLSYNELVGEIPPWLTRLDRLYLLRLDMNLFNGEIPPLNQTGLQVFNVSGNDLSGPIPLTPTLLDFGVDSFAGNPKLCGEIIGKECDFKEPFFKPTVPDSDETSPVGSVGPDQLLHGAIGASSKRSGKQVAFEIGFVAVLVVLVGLIVFLVVVLRRKMRMTRSKSLGKEVADDSTAVDNAAATALIKIEENELEEKVKKVQGMKTGKSGNLVFCAGEAHLYSMDQLMTASAEMLGRGTMGTTYKAVMENRLIMTVKRLDASKMGAVNKEMLERQLECVGGLRHPNLVPLRAYLLAQDERLLIYDYQPNGSLFSLIHGSKSTRAKPLHWTSCLKLAEDIAQGLSYIHQAWRLVHGNLKSTNVLLGSDFEACLTDYALVVLLAAPPSATTDEDSNSLGYKAPEVRKTNQQPTTKSDVYSFGVLLLELLTGKLPSKHPYLMPDELMKWVRATREASGGEDDKSLVMLVEVAIACSIASPEQRPTMWQVLKMIQEIKESVFVEDGQSDQLQGNLIGLNGSLEIYI